MNKTFNLYNERKQAVVTVSVYTGQKYKIKGIDGTQLEHINLLTNNVEEFKRKFNLLSYEELGQLTIDELLKP
ncbi:hypothetical protein CD122_05995 [Staphylococcus rostri]|uniref:Uncharacterized protein n=1 Tax=Staphylococcus rostri TaxID=522262 RepID=A0A2K3YQ12_9STAP|nr:hypothetical protein [Staphylococcus rostri]PNZ27695.1 hypothetical protein CD122_05995 [Staphylococcus rostri]